MPRKHKKKSHKHHKKHYPKTKVVIKRVYRKRRSGKHHAHHSVESSVVTAVRKQGWTHSAAERTAKRLAALNKHRLGFVARIQKAEEAHKKKGSFVDAPGHYDLAAFGEFVGSSYTPTPNPGRSRVNPHNHGSGHGTAGAVNSVLAFGRDPVHGIQRALHKNFGAFGDAVNAAAGSSEVQDAVEGIVMGGV